jgi:tyrosyl-tRNA synthetase
MSQSLGNYIGVREPVETIFGKVMSIPDELVGRYASLAANLEEEEVLRLEAAALGGGPQAGVAKRAVARAIVALYQGDEAATEAEASFDRQFKERLVPSDIPVADLPVAAVVDGKVRLPIALAALNLATSRAEARRLISQGGVRVNGTPVTSEDIDITELTDAVLQVGKRRFVKIR